MIKVEANTLKKDAKGHLSLFSELNKSELLKFCVFTENYGGSFYTVQRRIRQNAFNLWEKAGIIELIRRYAPDYVGEPCDFWRTLSNKAPFTRFMEERGMCRSTVRIRFSEFNFKEWELMGIENLIEEFKTKGL